MTEERMFELAQSLAVAKGRQDVPAALKLCHAEMMLEAPAFGSVAHGSAENERALHGFFASFPDYYVELEGHASLYRHTCLLGDGADDHDGRPIRGGAERSP